MSSEKKSTPRQSLITFFSSEKPTDRRVLSEKIEKCIKQQYPVYLDIKTVIFDGTNNDKEFENLHDYLQKGYKIICQSRTGYEGAFNEYITLGLSRISSIQKSVSEEHEKKKYNRLYLAQDIQMLLIKNNYSSSKLATSVQKFIDEEDYKYKKLISFTEYSLVGLLRDNGYSDYVSISTHSKSTGTEYLLKFDKN